MSLFKDMLKSNESLFIDEIALDFDFLPARGVICREKEQEKIALCIKPLFLKRSGKNILIYGSPGVGKTAAVKHVLRQLEEETDEIIPIYVNCWKKNSSYKIALDICEQLGFKFMINKRTDELIEMIKQKLNKTSVVFFLDEVDKLEDTDFLYSIIEDIYRKTIIMITNYKSWLLDLDDRIKSRLNAEMLEFREYNEKETREILFYRGEFAFVKGVWEDEAFNLVVDKTFRMKDIRTGLYLMKESALAAEDRSSRRIEKRDVEAAIKKFDEFSIRRSTDIEPDLKNIFDIVKRNDSKKMGELFEIYQREGGALSYKSFTRKVAKLEDAKLVILEKTEGGDLGNTTIVKLKSSDAVKKLTDF